MSAETDTIHSGFSLGFDFYGQYYHSKAIDNKVESAQDQYATRFLLASIFPLFSIAKENRWIAGKMRKNSNSWAFIKDSHAHILLIELEKFENFGKFENESFEPNLVYPLGWWGLNDRLH